MVQSQNAAGNYILASASNISAALSAGASSGLPAGTASWTTVSIVDNIFNNASATQCLPNYHYDLCLGISRT